MARVRFELPSFHSTAAVMAAVLVGFSVVVAIVKPLAGFVLLVPSLVVSQFFLWQVVTYTFVETSPLGVIFGAIIVYSIGGALEAMWGRQRFVRFVFGIGVTSALATIGVAYLVPSFVANGYAGGMVLTGSLWVAYGLTIGRGQTNFWGMPVSGNALAAIGAAFVFLNGAFGGLQLVIPEAFALLFTYLVVRHGVPGDFLRRLRSWRQGRAMKKRSAHLRSLDGGGSGQGSDKYLH